MKKVVSVPCGPSTIWQVLVLAFVTISMVTNPCHASTDERYDLQRLREIQQSIQSVVSKNLETCVAVSDGVGFGSGVIVSADGLVLTAGHVITGPGPFEIILPTGRTVKAKALGKNLDADTGMVQITESGPWPFVELADVQPAKMHDPLLGSWVVSLGHSGGFELGRVPPVRTGRILSRRQNQIVTDAVLIGGDSGGPLFDLDGKLIAIHSSIGDSIAENRHVTVDIFRRDWDRMVKGESWRKLPELNEPGEKRRPGKIGVIVDRTTERAVIKSVNEESSAAEAGLRAGDIVVTFNRTKIKNGDHLIETIKKYNAGQVFPMEIERNGRSIKFDIQLR
jgi:serine protease Do